MGESGINIDALGPIGASGAEGITGAGDRSGVQLDGISHRAWQDQEKAT